MGGKQYIQFIRDIEEVLGKMKINKIEFMRNYFFINYIFVFDILKYV